MLKISRFLLIMLCTAVLFSETLRVPANGKNIQESIDEAVNGDTVLVAPGVYKENIDFRGKNIVVASHYILDHDPKFIRDTIIDGSDPADPDAASCVRFISGENSGAVLQGFTITNGIGTVRREPNGTAWREGGGIAIIGSSPVVKNNLILKNIVMNTTNVASTGGGGICCIEGNPTILNNIITLNQARYAAGIMLYRSGVVLKNNVICQNSGGQDYGGGGLVMESNGPGPKIMENNTITANAAYGAGFYGGRAGALLVFKTSVSARNNIIWGNVQTNGKPIYVHHELTQTHFTYNDIEGGWDGKGNINRNPAFSLEYFTLSENSPCTHAGEPDGGVRNDMGAYGGPGSMEMTIPGITVPVVSYSGVPNSIPGKIEAEAFDWRPEGKAYHDRDEKNQGGMYRFCGVDIDPCDDFGGGYHVSHFQKGEWLNYTVNIAASTLYDLVVKAASGKNSGRFHMECDGQNLTGPIDVQATSGKQKWQRIVVPNIKLPAGRHVLRFVGEKGPFCINVFRLPLSASTLPAQWQNRDIGAVSEPGSAGVLEGVFYIEGSGKAAGHDYFNEADEFHFVYQKMSGNIEIIARIRSHTYTHEWGKAGVMIRETLDDKSTYASTAVTLKASPVLYRRTKIGELSDLSNWHTRTDFDWLKLTRKGNTFTGFKSRDGNTWMELEEKVDIPMAESVYVGLAITSHDDGALSAAAFDHVQVKRIQ